MDIKSSSLLFTINKICSLLKQETLVPHFWTEEKNLALVCSNVQISISLLMAKEESI